MRGRAILISIATALAIAVSAIFAVSAQQQERGVIGGAYMESKPTWEPAPNDRAGDCISLPI